MNLLIITSFLLVFVKLTKFNKFFTDGFDYGPDVLYFCSENEERHSFVGKALRFQVASERHVHLASCKLTLCSGGRIIAFSLLLPASSNLVKKPLQSATRGP